MASKPTTPKLPVPKSAAEFGPNVKEQDLRSQINATLLAEGYVAKIQNHLTQSLAASPTNWTQKISTHALNLIRSGECTTFPTLMERVMEDVKRDTDNARKAADEKKARSNGNGETLGLRDGDSEFGLALPRKVQEEGLKVTRECLEKVVEITD